MNTATTDRDIVSQRRFPFSREAVFEAWTNPELLAQWWGPKGFTNTFNVFEPKAGGNWDFVMHAPNGQDFHNQSVFVEVGPDRIVFDHLGPIHVFRVTATFEELNGTTNVLFRMTFDTVESCEQSKAYVPEANEQNFDRLETVLASHF
jgi:uncharacterized protein YndB with AHSA1/START domain